MSSRFTKRTSAFALPLIGENTALWIKDAAAGVCVILFCIAAFVAASLIAPEPLAPPPTITSTNR